eukprot:jgi/Chlat1/8787/Chrsp90S09250
MEEQVAAELTAARLGDGDAAERGNEEDEEDEEDMQARHRREAKALQARITGIKKGIPKNNKEKKKEAEKQILQLEEEMRARHASELASLHNRPSNIARSEGTTGDAPASTSNSNANITNNDDITQNNNSKTQTRAQKRRMDKARKEAERDARVELEKAEAGPGEGSVERDALAAALAKDNLAIRDIPPDGHCMFRAIEDQLSRIHNNNKEVYSYLVLRSNTAEYMRAHPDDYAPFVEPDDGEQPNGDNVDFGAYCDKMGGTAAWGGQLELRALACMLRRPIHVHAVGLPLVVMGEEFALPDTQPLRVSYHRHAYTLGEHYNSIIEADEEGAEVDVGDLGRHEDIENGDNHR